MTKQQPYEDPYKPPEFVAHLLVKDEDRDEARRAYVINILWCLGIAPIPTNFYIIEAVDTYLRTGEAPEMAPAQVLHLVPEENDE